MSKQIPLVPPTANELDGQQQVGRFLRPLGAPFGQVSNQFADTAQALAARAGHLERQPAERRPEVAGAAADAKSQVVVSLSHHILRYIRPLYVMDILRQGEIVFSRERAKELCANVYANRPALLIDV